MTTYNTVFNLLQYQNLDLLIVGVSIAAIGLLGMTIYMNDPKSATNRAFLAFAVVTVFWSTLNYVNYKVTSPDLVLWLLRGVIFLGVYHAFTFFHLFYTYPDASKRYPALYTRLLVPSVVVTSLWTLTPFVFSGIAQLAVDGSVSKTTVAPGMVIFLVAVLFLIGGGIFILIRKMLVAKGSARSPYVIISIGTITTFVLLVTFNLVLPAVFLNVRYIPFGALFMLPFVACMSIAIFRHGLFNLKVATTAFLGFMVTAFTFVNVLYSTSLSSITINVTAFIVVLIGSIKIVQDTLNSVRQRELIQKQ